MLLHLVPVPLRLSSPFVRYSSSCTDALQQRITEAPNKQTDTQHIHLEPDGHSVVCSGGLGAQQERAAVSYD